MTKQKKVISKHEGMSFGIIESVEQKEKRIKKSDKRLKDLGTSTKCINVYTMGSEGEMSKNSKK